MKSISKLVIAIIFLLSVSAFIRIGSPQKPWPVPDAAKNKKNPVASTAASINTGKSLWNTHCKSCHGTKGLGDGTKASQLDTDPGNFTKNEFHAQTDGALFYKTAQGRDDMPGFKSKIPDADDIWSLVNYMRSFKKGAVAPAVPAVPAKDTVKTPSKPPVVVTKPPVVETKPPVVVANPPVIKDTIAKKEPLSLQEQINRLGTRVDSLEKFINGLKAALDSLSK
jgi:mono/diheme cytochrome c family protein